jgi:hypothetical protein
VLRNLTLAFPLLSITCGPSFRPRVPARISRSAPRPQPSYRSPSPTRPSIFSRPPRPVLSPALQYTDSLLFWSSPVQIGSRLSHHAASPPSQFPGATIRSSVILIRNTPLRDTSFSSRPQVNSTRWKRLPPHPPPLSLTCQVDMSSSRAPLGVSLSLRFPFFVVGFANLYLSIPVHLMHGP